MKILITRMLLSFYFALFSLIVYFMSLFFSLSYSLALSNQNYRQRHPFIRYVKLFRAALWPRNVAHLLPLLDLLSFRHSAFRFVSLTQLIIPHSSRVSFFIIDDWPSSIPGYLQIFEKLFAQNLLVNLRLITRWTEWCSNRRW